MWEDLEVRGKSNISRNKSVTIEKVENDEILFDIFSKFICYRPMPKIPLFDSNTYAIVGFYDTF